MSVGTPKYGLLKGILDIIRENGIEEVYDSDWVTSELERRGQWNDKSKRPKSPERTINSYFSQNPHIFRSAGTRSNRYKLEPSFLEQELSNQTEQKAKQLLPTIRADCEAIEEENVSATEGTSKKQLVNRYDREAKLVARAIVIHGTSCMVCGFNFEELYGDWGKNAIEVHHLKPFSEVKESHETDPVRDMVVLCSNCHWMIHRKRRPVLTVDELKEKIGKRKVSLGAQL